MINVLKSVCSTFRRPNRPFTATHQSNYGVTHLSKLDVFQSIFRTLAFY